MAKTPFLNVFNRFFDMIIYFFDVLIVVISNEVKQPISL